MTTTPDVFIIESLRFNDEKRGHMEGRFVSHILNLADRKVLYYYIRTRAELEKVLDLFARSGFRYPHLSCHANKKGIELSLDDLGIDEIGMVFGPVLEHRRIFFSACEIATPELASALLKDTGCYSVVGPSLRVDFDEAALFWASLYHLMFKNDIAVMTRKELKRNLAKASKVFDLGIRYFARAENKKAGYVEVEIEG